LMGDVELEEKKVCDTKKPTQIVVYV
jgi:hypothetical protein